MDTSRLKRILIIKPSSLGDVIHALPVASALKAALHGVEVDWVVGKGYEDVLRDNPSISRVITFDRRMFQNAGGLGRLAGFVRELRQSRYDAVIDLQGLLRSGLMTFACRSGVRVGFENAREGAAWFYNGKVHVPKHDMHAVDRYLLALKRLGINTPDRVEFEISLSKEDDDKAISLLMGLGIDDGSDFVAVAPSARWETKRWGAGNFVRLANRLLKENGVKAVFVGTRDDALVMAGAGEALIQKDASAFGMTSLKTLAAVLKRARVLVTNDSGPMHIAAAVGTPAVAVFGPTDPKRTGPYGGIHRVVMAGVPCAPCFRKICPDAKCMSAVTVEMVYNEVLALL